MARPCGHADDSPTSVDVTETATKITTKTRCQCGQLLSTTESTKAIPRRPGRGKIDDDTRRRRR